MERVLNWRLKTTSLELGARTIFMAVLNVTPDSFSDGNMWLEPRAAVDHALDLLDCGADILDIGGESTRPGASSVAPLEEQRRVLPIVREILRRRPGAVLSIDTYHAETARLALDSGAEIVNDVSGGLWDDAMPAVWAASGCGVVVMHTRGRPQEWRQQPPLSPGEVVPLVTRELMARADEALAAGVARDAIVVDPGFGFGKILDENFPLLAGIGQIRALGFPVAAGLSRKGFLRKVLQDSVPTLAMAGPQADEALRDATIAANTAAVLAGAHILRVHDVVAARSAAAVADRILAAGRQGGPNFTIPAAQP
jgi:dihydropteroate synthase